MSFAVWKKTQSSSSSNWNCKTQCNSNNWSGEQSVVVIARAAIHSVV